MAYITSVKLPNNSVYDIRDKEAHWYGECDTAAAAAAKTVSISGFNLEAGQRIAIKFTYGNTAAAPTLSINSGAAKSFYLNNGNAALWDDGEICEFIYDGTNWNLINYNKIEVIRL